VSAVREALEVLGHSAGALPEARLLAALFVRFQAQVPLRRGPASFGADEALAAWLEDGAGCCGEPRVRAFEALALAAGFEVEGARARRACGGGHRVLLAQGRHVLLDPAFPLPAPLSLDPSAEAESTGYGRLSVRNPGGSRFEVLLETRGDERALYQVEPGEALSGGDGYGEACQGTGPEELFRLHDDRLLRWRSGALEVSDAWSRLQLPFAASDGEGLEALFGPPIPEIEVPDEAKPPLPEPTLAVYHASAAGGPSLKSLLADPVGHAALLPEGWTVRGLSVRENGFEWTLVEEGALLRTERVSFLPDGITVEAEGPFARFRTRRWRLEPRPAGTRLRLLATLRDPVPPRGLPEGVRRRLVFELASELLALDARAAEL
jgi:hypothetical protein